MSHNPRHIAIGFMEYAPSWITVLDQIGVHWQVVNSVTDFSYSDYSLVICNRTASERELSALQEFAESGGAVLYTISAGTIITNRPHQRRYVTSLPPASETLFHYHGIFDLFDDALFFNNGLFLETETFGNGIVSYFGIDLDRFFVFAKPIRKNFFADRERMPHEIVARRSRAALRQLVQSHLEFLHHHCGLPFVHKWFYPFDQQTLFTFRVDSDKGTQEQIDEIYQLSEKYDIPTTWFLDVKSHESWLKYFQKFTKQEIGVHCYEHTVFNSALLNRENFEKALKLLHQHGFQPVGITAPTGAWNHAIGTAIQELGFLYSSEFAYDYDNLPSFPTFGTEPSSVLQLPIHPACIGIMRREQMSEKEMVHYFISIIDQMIEQREPICLYQHPTHGMNGVFEEVFRYINGKKIQKMLFREYALWWKRREEFGVEAVFDRSTLTFAATNVSDDTYIRVTYAGQRESIIRVQNTINIETFPILQSQDHRSAPPNIMRARKKSYRHYIQNALDWWIKTTE